MPARDREVLTRFYLQEQTVSQIAEEMSITETQFRLIKSRAKARFSELGRKMLLRRAEGPDPVADFFHSQRSSPDSQAMEHTTKHAVPHTSPPAEQVKAATSLATDVFEDPAVAEKWLNDPNLATDNLPPLVLLGTPEGFDRVKTLLQRIEYGVLA
jgi:hypothetical protein